MLVAVLLGTLPACDSSDHDDITLHVMSEDYYPYNYRENGEWKGSSYETVREILLRNGRTETVEGRDWTSAMAALETEEHAILFTTTLTPERKSRFQWAGPIGRIEWALYAKSPEVGELRSLADADNYRIGVVQDYPMHEQLRAAGHPDLVVFATEEASLNALFEGQVDLAATSTDTMYFYTVRHTLPAPAVHKVYDVKTELLYIAFSAGMPESIVRQWQQTLDDMKDERLFAEMYQRSLPFSAPPEKLQLYTEPYPPITFRDGQGRITGGASEMVRAILGKAGAPDNMVLTNWANAYQLALDNPRVALFSTERTAAREELFNWVGPIGRNSANFYTKNGSGLVVDSLAAAKSLRAIGTCSSWFTEQMLREQGFTNLVSVTEPERLAVMLMSGEIDATVFTDITMKGIIEAAGFDMALFSKQHLLTSSDFYIALSRGTDPETIEAWRSALREMVADGTFASIYSAWYPNAESPY